MHASDLVWLFKRTVSEWLEDKAPSRAASLSYYTTFSLAPLLLIAVAIAGLVFGRDAVRGQLARELQGLLGPGSARAIQDMMTSASRPGVGVLASIVGVVMLVVGSTGAFVELQDTLNAMWDVDEKKDQGLWGFLRARLLSFAMIGVIAFLLLVSLVVSAGLAALGHFAQGRLPCGEAVLHTVNFLVSFAVITVLFAAIFKVLPDVKIPWRDVWLGAAVTSFLFVIGKLLIGLYIGKSSVASSYGAAGSFAVILVWVNYSAMILLFGAEFTQVYSRSRGSHRAGTAPPPGRACAGGTLEGRPGVRAARVAKRTGEAFLHGPRRHLSRGFADERVDERGRHDTCSSRPFQRCRHTFSWWVTTTRWVSESPRSFSSAPTA